MLSEINRNKRLNELNTGNIASALRYIIRTQFPPNMVVTIDVTHLYKFPLDLVVKTHFTKVRLKWTFFSVLFFY